MNLLNSYALEATVVKASRKYLGEIKPQVSISVTFYEPLLCP